jgi:protein SCO1/2
MSQQKFSAPRARARGLPRTAVIVALLLAFAAPQPAVAQAAPPPEGTPVTFALTAADGDAVTEQSYRGKWLIVYFGYTFCPDICPATLLEISAALAVLGPRADAVQGLFVTVDPRRDTPAVLAANLE